MVAKQTKKEPRKAALKVKQGENQKSLMKLNHLNPESSGWTQ
jgi:hypothetical protein